jgi:hypothetical protein
VETAGPRERIRTLVLAIDLDEAEIQRLVEQLTVLRQETLVFDPIYVTSSPDLRVFRNPTFGVEHVMSYEDWSKVQDPTRWILYLETRLQSIVRTYGPANILIAGGITREGGIDKNLYGALLRLSAGGVVGDRLGAKIDEIAEEVELMNLNLLTLEKKLDGATRSILKRLVDPKAVQRLRQAFHKQPTAKAKSQ